VRLTKSHRQVRLKKMPYPLAPPPPSPSGTRVRLLPPLGCPGPELFVTQLEAPRWLLLGYRGGPVPQDALELFWLVSPLRWDELESGAAIELLIDPLDASPAAINVDWGDGSSEVVGWPVISRKPPRPRHYYTARADQTVTVSIGGLTATLLVALLGCPVAPDATAARLRPLLAGAGLSGDHYDGSLSRTWQIRLHPNGGLALQLDAATGQQALALMTRPARIYSGSGPPPPGLSPAPIAGDFFLDLLAGRVYEFT